MHYLSVSITCLLTKFTILGHHMEILFNQYSLYHANSIMHVSRNFHLVMTKAFVNWKSPCIHRLQVNRQWAVLSGKLAEFPFQKNYSTVLQKCVPIFLGKNASTASCDDLPNS